MYVKHSSVHILPLRFSNIMQVFHTLKFTLGTHIIDARHYVLAKLLIHTGDQPRLGFVCIQYKIFFDARPVRYYRLYHIIRPCLI